MTRRYRWGRANSSVNRPSRRAYDRTKIFFTDYGFKIFTYHKDIFFQLIKPSASHHFLIDSSKETALKRSSVAHELMPNSYERFFLVIGADKSITANLFIRFYLENGEIIESPLINIDIWNPKNTFFSKHGGEKLELNSLPTLSDDKILGVYSKKELAMKISRKWEY